MISDVFHHAGDQGDAIRRENEAEHVVGAALRALTVARGDAAEQAAESASRLVDDVKAGDVPARVAMAELLRKLIGGIKFVDGQVIIEPRRPVSVSVYDVDGRRFDTPVPAESMPRPGTPHSRCEIARHVLIFAGEPLYRGVHLR
jgi:hypothetical protein